MQFTGLSYSLLAAALEAPSSPLSQMLAAFLACAGATQGLALDTSATLISTADAADPTQLSGLFPVPVVLATAATGCQAPPGIRRRELAGMSSSAGAHAVQLAQGSASLLRIVFSVAPPSSAALHASQAASVVGAVAVALDPIGAVNNAAVTLATFFASVANGNYTAATWPVLSAQWSVLGVALASTPLTQLTLPVPLPSQAPGASPAPAVAAVSVFSITALSTISPVSAPTTLPGSPVGAIVGGVLGGAVGIAALVVSTIYCRRRSQRLRERRNAARTAARRAALSRPRSLRVLVADDMPDGGLGYHFDKNVRACILFAPAAPGAHHCCYVTKPPFLCPNVFRSLWPTRCPGRRPTSQFATGGIRRA